MSGDIQNELGFSRQEIKEYAVSRGGSATGKNTETEKHMPVLRKPSSLV